MKKGDWLIEPYDVDGTVINVLMEILSVADDEAEIKWYGNNINWPEASSEIIARDEIEHHISKGEIIIISETEAAKYLLAGAK